MSNGKHSANGDRKYKIHATRNGPSNYSFRLTDMNNQQADLVFNKDTNNMRKRDYYELEFHLHNEPGSDLVFVDDRDKVFSACGEAEAVNGCAPEGSTFLPTVYLHPTRKIQDRVITVVNTDSHVEKFFFGFSFVSRSHGDSAYYDPGGENEDRGIGTFDWNYAIAGAISGAVAAIGTATLMASQFVPYGPLLYGTGGAILGLIVGYLLGRR